MGKKKFWIIIGILIVLIALSLIYVVYNFSQKEVPNIKDGTIQKNLFEQPLPQINDNVEE